MSAKFLPVSVLCSRARGEATVTPGERRVVAIEPIPPGSLLAVFGGVVMDGAELMAASDHASLGRITLQIDEDAFLVSTHESPADWINHSCEPNAGLRGQVSLVALRRITTGEEITFDYATSDGSSYDEFDCGCGSPQCRSRVCGDDWQRPELWTRYRGHFSPYLARRIEAMQRSVVVFDAPHIRTRRIASRR